MLEELNLNQKSRTNHVNMFRQEIGSNRLKKEDLQEKGQLKMDLEAPLSKTNHKLS